MSHRSDSAMGLDYAIEQPENATMNDSSQAIRGYVTTILGSEITYMDTVIIRRCSSPIDCIKVWLSESRNDDDNKSNAPFKAAQSVLIGNIFGNVYPVVSPRELIILPSQENKDIVLRAYNYLIAKKNRMYLEFRREYTNGVFESNEPPRVFLDHEDVTFTTRAASAALKPRGQRLMMRRKQHLIMNNITGILLLASHHPVSGELELYHPESEGIYKGRVSVNDIVLWESEDALFAFFKWIYHMDVWTGPIHPFEYNPEDEKTKREAGHRQDGPEKKKGRVQTEAEAEDQDDDMMDIDVH